MYYVQYTLHTSYYLATLSPVPAECVMPKCIYYLYFFSEISIYFCVPIFITRALWHNSKHNKCAPSGIERFGGVLGPCLIIFCAVTKKKKKRTGKKKRIERRNVLQRMPWKYQPYKCSNLFHLLYAQGLRRKRTHGGFSVLCPAVMELR